MMCTLTYIHKYEEYLRLYLSRSSRSYTWTTHAVAVLTFYDIHTCGAAYHGLAEGHE